jgi:hypothetical protein
MILLVKAATTILLLWQGNQAADHLISRPVSTDRLHAVSVVVNRAMRVAGTDFLRIRHWRFVISRESPLVAISGVKGPQPNLCLWRGARGRGTFVRPMIRQLRSALRYPHEEGAPDATEVDKLETAGDAMIEGQLHLLVREIELR